MRWFNFGILVFMVLLLQLAVVDSIALGPQRIRPDLLLLVAVVIALNGPEEQAPTAGWILGLCKDLTSEATLGSYAIGFGLTVWMIVKIRDLFLLDRALTIIILTLIGAFALEQLVLLISYLKSGSSAGGYATLTGAIFFSAAFTAGLAPYARWLMLKMARLFGLRTRRGYN